MVSTAESELADMGVVLRLLERRCAGVSREWALPLFLPGPGVGIVPSLVRHGKVL